MSKTAIDTIICPKWLLPMESGGGIFEHYALLIHQGNILALLPVSEALEGYTADTILHLTDHVLMPGLINSHAHNPMTLFRGMADDLALMDWLNHHIWPSEQRWLGEDFIRDGTELAMLEMLRSGTTCFNENYFFSEVSAQTAAAAGMRAVIGSVVINLPTGYADSLENYLIKMKDFSERWKNHELITPSIHPHSPYMVDDKTFLYLASWAQEKNWVIHTHLHETQEEIDMSLKHYGKRPIRRLYDLGVLSKRLIAVHMCHINEEDLTLLAETGVNIVHCPESNLKLASGFSPVSKFLAQGLNVALGTDGAASNNDLDMFGEMRTAAILAKAVAQDPTALNANQALEMATRNAAKAFGLEQKIGTLAPGKSADIIAIDLSESNTQPVYHPASHLVYAVNSRQVTDVWVNGKRLLKNRELTTLDEAEILKKANLWRNKIQ